MSGAPITRAGYHASNVDGPGSETLIATMRLEHNKLVADVEVLRAGLLALTLAYELALTKLDNDATVTDVDYNSLHAVDQTSYDAAADLTGAVINLS